MNIQFGIYDVFSRIVPGGLYLFAIMQFSSVLGLIKIDWEILKDVGVIPSLGLLLIAYILGTGMDRLGSRWFYMFKKPGMSDRILEEFKAKHADRWVFEFEDKDWTMLRAYIRVHNRDVAGDIDRDNAICIMLRNISLGLVLIAFNVGIHFAKTVNWADLILIVLLFVLSYLVAIQARFLRKWFYEGVFETIMAYRLDLEERVKPVKTSVKGKNTK